MRDRRAATLRLSIACLALAAAFDPRVAGGSRSSPPVLLVDVSASVDGAALGEGGDVEVGERFAFADGVVPLTRGEDPVGLPRERTRMADAIALGAERVAGVGGVVWLATDGRDTEGTALAAARDLARRGGRLFVSSVAPAPADVAVSSARVLGTDPAGALLVSVRLQSSVSGRVRVVLRRGAETADAREVAVAPGAVPTVALSDAAGAADRAAREVVILPLPGTPDDDLENDRVLLPVPVGPRSVVVLDPERWPEALAGAPPLVDAGEVVSAELESADLLVVSNWRRMPDEGAERLARYVAGGGRLLVLGGPDAYGPGGWRGTAFERLLPLRSKPDDVGSDVVIALDRSGSTGGPRAGGRPSLDALVDALSALLASLPPDARVLVLPFAATPDAPLSPGWAAGDEPGKRSALSASARALVAGGGTDLDRAVAAAAAELRARPRARRHVMLLTDGDPDHALDASSFAGAKAALAAAGAGFHAVVRGDARAAAALRSLAASDEDVALIEEAGRFSEALATAFGRAEAGNEIVRESFRVLAPPSSEAEAFARGAPVAGMHRLVVAPDAALLATADGLGAHRGGVLPFAASRAVGAGRVVALAWGPALESEADRPSARARLASWLAALAEASDRGLAADMEGETLTLAALPAWAGAGTVRAYANPGEPADDVAPSSTLLEIAPGVFRGDLPAAADAPLFVEGPAGARRPLRLPARPRAEHRGAGIDEAALAALAEAGAGARLPAGARPPLAVVRSSLALAPFLLIAAVLAFVAERARALSWASRTGLAERKG